MKPKRILIFGGSFDPPHKIHLQILKDATKIIKPDISLVVPTYLSPFKKTHLFSYSERRKMLRILFKSSKIEAKIYDFEYHQRKKTYTWMLVQNLKEIYPKAELYFLIGSDAINTLKKWKRYNYLADKLIFVVAKRGETEIEIDDKVKIIQLPNKYPDISSTRIREEIFTGNFTTIPKSIRRFIEKKLKVKRLIRRIKLIMSKERFKHTLEATKLAVKLAFAYGADIRKVAYASLLHDVAKDLPIERQIRIIKKCRLRIKDLNLVIQKAPQILHQWASMCVAKKRFGVKDKEILSAISKHTTGSKDLSTIDKIIYLSDIAALDRDFPEVERIRRLLFLDLDKAFEKARKVKLEYLKRTKRYIYEP